MNGEAFELEFNHTLKTAGAKARGWLINYLSNIQDAEDVYSESIKDLWKFGEKFEGYSSLATPFFVIVRRRVVDFLRKKYKQEKIQYSELAVPYLLAQPMFRLNMLLHPLWKHKLDGDQLSLIQAVKKTMEGENGTRRM